MHPGTSVVGGLGGQERALNLPAITVCGPTLQDFLRAYIPGRRINYPAVATFFGPLSPPRSSHLAPTVSPALSRTSPRPPAPPPPFASQDALRGPGRKSASSRVCVCVCVSKRRAARDKRWGIPSEASPLSLPSPTEPLLEGSRPGASPGREDVAPVHQGR